MTNLNQEYVDAAQKYLDFKVKHHTQDLKALQKITNDLSPLLALSKNSLSCELTIDDNKIFILSVLLVFQNKTEITVKTKDDVLWGRVWVHLDEKIADAIRFEAKIGLGYELDINSEIFKLIIRNLILSLPQTPEEKESNEFRIRVMSQELIDEFDEKDLFALKNRLLENEPA